jgi:hypothetical protein
MQALEERLSMAAATLAAPLEPQADSAEAGSGLIDIREEYDEVVHGSSSAGQL